MIKRVLLILALLAVAATFTPGVLPAIEELIGLGGPMLMPVPRQSDRADERKGDAGLDEPTAKAAGSSLSTVDGESAEAASGETAASIALPAIDSDSTLGVLTRIQTHAEGAGIVCHTIETRSEHGSDGQPSGAGTRWHVAGHGEPGPLVAFVTALENDDELAALQTVEFSPHDEQRLDFSIDLSIDRRPEGD